jgi:hypothetical protein
MGYNAGRIEVSYSTSAHNSDQDVIDEALADELRDAIAALVADPKFRSITPMMF